MRLIFAAMMSETSQATVLPPLAAVTPQSATPAQLQLGTISGSPCGIQVALLTGGGDKPYALGMASALINQGIQTDFIGSDEVNGPALHGSPLIRFLNLRGDQSPNAGMLRKAFRVCVYYWRLVAYAVRAKPQLFHILWHNKFEFIDRTVLMGFYKLIGKRIIFTAHNVNAGKRDGNDSWVNRLSLKCQYGLADHILVHTELMKRELIAEFGVAGAKISVIPFGINNTLPNTSLTRGEARRQLGIQPDVRTVLFFGNIAPYKGLEYLVAAMAEVMTRDSGCRLVIAGRPKGCEEYWARIQTEIAQAGMGERVVNQLGYIPDEEVEVYLKAADVLVLPYVNIFQSGVLFLGYSFGLPVIASDVGSMKADIIEGETGFVCQAKDPHDLARAIERYFRSALFAQLEHRRESIRQFANRRYSWDTVGHITSQVYSEVLGRQPLSSEATCAQK